MVYTLRRRAIPPLKLRKHKAKCPVPNGGKAIVFTRIPDVSHRSVAITDVRRAASFYTFCYSMTGTDHEIEPTKIQRFNGSREERQEVPVVTVHTGNAIQPGNHNVT